MGYPKSNKLLQRFFYQNTTSKKIFIKILHLYNFFEWHFGKNCDPDLQKLLGKLKKKWVTGSVNLRPIQLTRAMCQLHKTTSLLAAQIQIFYFLFFFFLKNYCFTFFLISINIIIILIFIIIIIIIIIIQFNKIY